MNKVMNYDVAREFVCCNYEEFGQGSLVINLDTFCVESVDRTFMSGYLDEDDLAYLKEHNLVLLPYFDELAPYGTTMKNFLNENDICIPRGEKAIHYLGVIGLLSEWDEYRAKVAENKLNEWFLDHGWELVTM